MFSRDILARTLVPLSPCICLTRARSSSCASAVPFGTEMRCHTVSALEVPDLRSGITVPETDYEIPSSYDQQPSRTFLTRQSFQ